MAYIKYVKHICVNKVGLSNGLVLNVCYGFWYDEYSQFISGIIMAVSNRAAESDIIVLQSEQLRFCPSPAKSKLLILPLYSVLVLAGAL